jgi:sugar-phosphatase
MQGKVFLFDMDGTLINSHEVIEAIWRRWAGRHHLDSEALLAKSHGRQAIETIRLFAPAGVDVEAEAAWFGEQAVQETAGIRPVEGARSLLARLSPHEWALVTSAKRLLAERWLRAAGLPQPVNFIAAEDVARGKPDPEGYRLGARRLGCSIEEAIVFEDAEAGLEAGRRAGAKVVGVGGANHLSHLADAWIADFRQVQIAREVHGGFTLRFTG